MEQRRSLEHVQKRRQKQRRRERWLFFGTLIPAALVLLFLCVYVNRYIHIHALYKDDLYLWSFFSEENFFEFTFPKTAKVNYRPASWALNYLDFVVTGAQVDRYLWFNLAMNTGIAVTIFIFARRLASGFFIHPIPAASVDNRDQSDVARTYLWNQKTWLHWWLGSIIGVLAGGLYLISEFSYYQIAQLLGGMESEAQWLALSVLFFLYLYIDKKSQRAFITAEVFYFFLIFTHERFMALLPLFYIALLFTNRQCWKTRNFLVPMLMTVFFMAVRATVMGQLLPNGTAGTDVTETFSLEQALTFSVDQVKYLFGMNVGPDYLSGTHFEAMPKNLQYVVYGSIGVLGIMVLLYLVSLFRHPKKESFGKNLLFILFIALCIGSSSITIRLEMRWIYVSYSAAILYLAMMCGELTKLQESKRDIDHAVDGENKRSRRRKERSMIAAVVFTALYICYAALMVPVEKYYRTQYYNIFLFLDQDRMNSLADLTIGRYGVEGVLGKQIYIFYNTYEMTDFYADYFYRPFDPEKTGQGSKIHFLQDMAEIPPEATRENSFVLMESPDGRGYVDLTETFLHK